MSVLVYDIGLHDGRDTGHYLREGCRVVAVDANPVMCAAAQTKFREYVRTGQLKVINCGVAEQKRQLEFWVCDDNTEWSSFQRYLASRNGAKNHSININCMPIGDIIDEFGVADYMKIDIEGNDRICISGLTNATAPRYISIEMNGGEQDLQILSRLGYRSFKVICQNNSWHQVTTHNIGFYEWPPKNFIMRILRKFRATPSWLLAGRSLGESGPWGEKTSGAWHSVDHAYSVWRSLREIDVRQNTHGLGWWFDIHAKK